MTEMREIRVSAVVLRRDDGCVLSVRKHGTHMFMLPGGKPEANETPRGTAIREIREELGLDLAPDSLTELGTFSANAANEAGFRVTGTVFVHNDLVDATQIHPLAELEELRWVDPHDPRTATLTDQAPLTLEQVFPRLHPVNRGS